MILTDEIGRKVNVHQPLSRIVSLVPSHTELLADLFGIEKIVGRTKFCIHPQEIKLNTPMIGGTKMLHIDAILALKPDLIFANKEENNKEDIEQLEKYIPVYVSDISSLQESYDFIKQIGKICAKPSLIEAIIRESEKVLETNKISMNKTAAYLIWKKPYMSVGKNTYIHDIMKRLGFANVFHQKERYPETSIEEIQSLNPNVILLSSEPYPFKQSDIQELREHFPSTDIQLVDGEFFSWYGSRIPKLTSFKM